MGESGPASRKRLPQYWTWVTASASCPRSASPQTPLAQTHMPPPPQHAAKQAAASATQTIAAAQHAASFNKNPAVQQQLVQSCKVRKGCPRPSLVQLQLRHTLPPSPAHWVVPNRALSAQTTSSLAGTFRSHRCPCWV